MFVIYINDLPDSVDSYIVLYADGTKMYKEIQLDSDKIVAQDDLLLHPDKCIVIRPCLPWKQNTDKKTPEDRCCGFWLSRERWYRKSVLPSTGAGCAEIKIDKKYKISPLFSSISETLYVWSLKLSV